jgi:hypothetical protein
MLPIIDFSWHLLMRKDYTKLYEDPADGFTYTSNLPTMWSSYTAERHVVGKQHRNHLAWKLNSLKYHAFSLLGLLTASQDFRSIFCSSVRNWPAGLPANSLHPYRGILVLLEQLTVADLVSKSAACYAAKFIAMFTSRTNPQPMSSVHVFRPHCLWSVHAHINASIWLLLYSPSDLRRLFSF